MITYVGDDELVEVTPKSYAYAKLLDFILMTVNAKAEAKKPNLILCKTIDFV